MSEIQFKKECCNVTPLEQGGDWVEEFINSLGGDFSITQADDKSIVLQNRSSCPGLCLGRQDHTTCNDIEKVLSEAVRLYNSKISVGFVECAHNKGASCKLVVSFNP